MTYVTSDAKNADFKWEQKKKQLHFVTVSALKNKNTRPQINFPGYYIVKMKV